MYLLARGWAFVFFLLLTCIGFAQELKLRLEPAAGPYAPTTLIRVHVEGHQEGDTYLWDVIFGSRFPDYQPYNDGGSSMVFTGTKGTYMILVKGLRNGKLVGGRIAIPIGDPKPDEPDDGGDDDTDPPAPPTIPDTDKVALACFAAAKDLPTIAKKKAPDVAKAYREVAKGLLDGTIPTTQTAATQLHQKRQDAMGDPATWQDWKTKLEKTWTDFLQANDLKPTKVKLAEFYNSIALGLEAVR